MAAVDQQRATLYPLGAAATVDELDRDPHPLLHRLRAAEPVSWLSALDGWLVTRHDLVVAAMRDADTFTVDDPRFSTAQVVGPSMLSLDGDGHARHRAPFVGPFRAAAVQERFAAAAADEARRLVQSVAPLGRGDLRRLLAAPMATAIVARALGLRRDEVDEVLGWYEAIVASVTSITAGAGATLAGADAYAGLSRRLRSIVAEGGTDSLLGAAAGAGADAGAGAGDAGAGAGADAVPGELTRDQVVSNAAVILFGGIETTEGMIATALMHLLRAGRAGWVAERVAADAPDAGAAVLDAVIDESLRLEPAAGVIDRYATRQATLGGASIAAGELVRLSLTAANRDPAVFADPDAFDPGRPNLRRHLAFAQGPHVCVGVHLARLEARAALRAALEGLPGLRLDPASPARVSGLVFRKPRSLNALWG